MSRRAAVLVALALAAGGCATRRAPATPPATAASPRSRLSVRACEPGDVERWRRLRCASLGVSAEDGARNLDPVPPTRGRTPAPSVLVREGNAVDGFHTWVPVSGLKETACGRPEGYEENCATRLGLFAECDLNNDLRPDPGSLPAQYLEVMQCGLEGGGHDEVGSDPRAMMCFDQDVLHVEITPPQAPAVTPYGLRRELRRLWKTGREEWRRRLWDGRLCAYGPFVGDRSHNFKPEIHPAQLVWWNLWPADRCRPARGPDGPFALFLLQDASSRFSEPHHFYLRDRPDERWRPWAAGPLDGTFHIAFWARRDEPPTFTLAALFGERPALGAPREVVDRQGDVLARLDDTRLRGALPGYASVEVDVERACRDPADDALLGVLRVRARAGTGREWEEGHAALRLSDSRAEAAAATALAVPAAVDGADADGASAPGEVDAGEPPAGGEAPETGDVSRARDASGVPERAAETPPEQLGDAAAARGCRELCPEGRKAGAAPRPAQPRFEPRIVLRDARWERVGASAGDALARRARAGLLVALAGGPGAPAPFAKLPELPVAALRRFVLRALDDVIAPGREGALRLDRDPPPAFAWDVSVRDADGGAPLEGVRITPRGADCAVEIVGGTPGPLYEVAASVSVAGRFTDAREGQRRVWRLERTRRQRLWTNALETPDGLADARRLTRLLRERGAPRNRDYDRLLDLAAARAVADGRVSVGELRLLARQSGLLWRAKRAVPLEREAPLDDAP
jgi:hypothetical protein